MLVEEQSGERTVTVFEAEVVAARPVSPSLIRVELGGPDLATFEPLEAPDEACVLHVPLPEGGTDERGRWYSVCAVETLGEERRVIVELVAHAGGVAAAWAQRATVGDRVRISVRSSWFRRPVDATWQLLLGDIAALPAFTRIVGETPAGLATQVVVEIPDRGDARTLGDADVTWVHNPELAAGSGLETYLRGRALPEGPGYVYVAGEAAATRAARRYLRHELRVPAERYGVIGYWRRDAERWIARYESAVAEYERIWRHAEQTGRDDEEIRDIYEAELAEAGLL